MIRDYIVGQSEILTLISIGTADGSNQFIKVDGVLVNGFSDLVLYSDAAGTTAVPDASYEMTTIDTGWTSDEAQTGGTGKTVYSQFKVTNATYQGIDLWATFTNFGTYTSNDAAFDQVGGSEEVTTSATLVVPEGYTRYRFNFDSSSGDIAPTIGNGAFDGQQIILKDTGEANMTRIKGSGFYLGADSGGMYLKSRSILCTWNGDDSEWEMDDAVTAEWVSGDFTVIIESSGRIKQEYTDTSTQDITSLAGALFRTLTAISGATFPVAFLSIPHFIGVGHGDGRVTIFYESDHTTTTTTSYYGIRTASSSSVNLGTSEIYTGKY